MDGNEMNQHNIVINIGNNYFKLFFIKHVKLTDIYKMN